MQFCRSSKSDAPESGDTEALAKEAKSLTTLHGARTDLASLRGHVCVRGQALGPRTENGVSGGHIQVEGTRVKGRNVVCLEATHHSRVKPRGAVIGHPSLFLLSLASPALQPIAGTQEGDSLEKAVSGGKQPERVDEDSSADVHALVQQAGLPRPPASRHILATIDPPRHFGPPTHCGNTPPACP